MIPTLDEAETVIGAIESARTGSSDRPDRDGLEILVVDGGSRDATREQALAAGALVLESPPGRARQLACGLQACRGDVVLFLHADTRLPAGWHRAIEEALRDPQVVGGAFRFAFDRRSPALRLVEWGTRLRVALLGLPYGDQALFARRGILDQMGGVPQAPIMEDLDLVKALRGRGRLALLDLAASTSARRYLTAGVWRTMLRHWTAAAGWMLGVDRGRIAAWYRR